MRRLPLRVAVIAVSACALVACAGSDEASDTMPTATAPPATIATTMPPTTAAPPTTAPPTTTTLDDRTAVVAAYTEYRAAVKQLLRQPDPASPVLTQTMMGRQRALLRQRVQERIDGHYRLEDPVNSIARESTAVESLQADTAVVVSCSVDDSFRRHLDDMTISNAEIATTLFRTTLLREEGRWKVEFMSTERTWEGVAGCAA